MERRNYFDGLVEGLVVWALVFWGFGFGDCWVVEFGA